MCRGDPRTLEPLAYTGANSSEFCYPILDLTPQILPKFTCVYLFKELPAGGGVTLGILGGDVPQGPWDLDTLSLY